MHTSRGVTFTFSCDNAGEVQRRYVYLRSGKGSYVIPFSVPKGGSGTVTVDRNACMREEGTVSGWRNISEIMVSFWHEEGKPVKWSVKDMALRTDPYLAVVVTPGRSVHDFPKRLEECGMPSLIVTADELDDAILSSARLLAPVWSGDRKYPQSALDAIKRFEAKGGAVISSRQRVAARSHGRLLELLRRSLPDMASVFDGKLAEEAMKKKKDAEAAARLPAFLLAGGDDEIRGVSCHTAYGPEHVDNDPKWENWDENCRLLKAAGFNAVNVNVARGGIAFYESDVLPMSPEVKTKGDSVELIKKACEKHGMKFVAWKVCFYSRRGMKTPLFERWMSEGRCAVSASGKKSDTWLCPVQEVNRKLEVDALVELAKRGPWAISLDYIRYYASDWCFCGHCRKAFEKYAGVTVENWPKDALIGQKLHGKWEEFRRHVITSVVRETAKRVRVEAPGVKVRADVFSRPGGGALSVAQDWGSWCREGLLDTVCPMDGVSSPEELASLLEIQLPAAGKVPLMPTYYPSMAKRLYNADNFMETVRVGRRYGVPGFFAFRFDGRLIEMFGIGKETGK